MNIEKEPELLVPLLFLGQKLIDTKYLEIIKKIERDFNLADCALQYHLTVQLKGLNIEIREGNRIVAKETEGQFPKQYTCTLLIPKGILQSYSLPCQKAIQHRLHPFLEIVDYNV